MFVGHYGVSFAARRCDASVPLWALFVAVQLLDFIWAPLVLLGIEKVRIVPGFTATNPLDLYYMPYTHSLVAACLWSAGAFAVYRLARRRDGAAAALVVAGAVLSHWVLDFVVHRPDLPLFDDSVKVGLGLWNWPGPALALEAALLLGGMAISFRAGPARRAATTTFCLAMLAIQVVVFFGPPPASGKAAAAYVAFAAIIGLIEGRRSITVKTA